MCLCMIMLSSLNVQYPLNVVVFYLGWGNLQSVLDFVFLLIVLLSHLFVSFVFCFLGGGFLPILAVGTMFIVNASMLSTIKND